MSKLQVVNELYRSARKNFKRRSYVMRGVDDTFQADLIEMIPYAKENKNHKYILLVIDTFSKFIWVRPLKNKTGLDTTKAMKSIYEKSKRIPKCLQTDMGKEFYNSHFKRLMNHHNINHYSSYSLLKASIAERANRTILTKLWKEFAMQGNHKWLNTLQKIVAQYTHTKHRTIKQSPASINKENENKILSTVYKKNRTLTLVSKNKFKLNDIVRISRYKSVFDKSYLMNWSMELFHIDRILSTEPTTYLLKDMNGQPISG